MLSEAKHLGAHRGRPFAALRVTTYDRSWLVKIIIGQMHGHVYPVYFIHLHYRPPLEVPASRLFC